MDLDPTLPNLTEWLRKKKSNFEKLEICSKSPTQPFFSPQDVDATGPTPEVNKKFGIQIDSKKFDSC